MKVVFFGWTGKKKNLLRVSSSLKFSLCILNNNLIWTYFLVSKAFKIDRSHYDSVVKSTVFTLNIWAELFEANNVVS